ncbi:MAG: hypothetical protein E7262_01510 [Lachnospiraceae bacterium]|nr:hypothetical protein [Lachnospiraceae bacterium]
MKNIKVLKRALAIVMTLVTVIGITTVHVQKSNANQSRIPQRTVSTDTLDMYWDELANMTLDEFESVFCNAEYNREFVRNYDMVRRGESTLDKLKAKIALMKDKTGEYIDVVTDNIMNKLPKMIKEKLNIDKLGMKKIVQMLVGFLNDSNMSVKAIVAAIAAATGWKALWITPVVDVILKVLDIFFNKSEEPKSSEEPSATPVSSDNEEPDVSEEPTGEPTDIPSETEMPTGEPIVDETENPQDNETIDPIGEGFDELNEDDGGLLNCPPRPVESEQPINTEVPVTEAPATDIPTAA